MTLRRGLSRCALAVLVLPLAVACSTTPDPADEAALLAADLADGTLDTAALSAAPADPDAALAGLLGNLTDLPRTVTIGEPTEAGDDGGTTTVPLTWAWDLGGEEWEVETTATLELVEGEWATRWSPTLVHPDAVDGSTLRLASEPATRGDVLSQDGTALVTDRAVYRVGIDKAHIETPEAAEAAARELATRLEFDDVAAFAARVAAAGPRAYVVAITVRAEEAERWDIEGLRKVPGVLVQSDEIPLAPTATFARPLLGTVGEATAEIVEESGGAIRAGDVVGLSGLQRAFDERLRGTPGTTVTLVTEEEVELHATEPVDGTDLVLTLEEPYQIQAEGLLADIESASAIVAVRPSDGTILAAASGPGGGGLNTATVGLYAPGSTFKIATALALLRAGLTAHTPVPCTPTVTVDGREFENFPGYPAASLGDIPLREAIAQSCNTALIAQHEAVTAKDVASAAAALGIATPGTWSFPFATGAVPDDATGTSHAASLIGQGDVLASPLAMAVAAASVAAGQTVTPVLVVGEEADVVAPATPLTDAEAGVLAELMRGVVATGTSTFLRDVPGDVGAKSGTAQWGTGEQVHAWMIAFRDDLAVAVFVEDGEYGTATAGPLLEAFLRNVP